MKVLIINPMHFRSWSNGYYLAYVALSGTMYNYWYYPQQKQGSEMKILVRNLSRSTTEDELSEVFSKFGDIEYCNLVLDKMSGKSKGFGFVEIADDKKALLAIVKLNGTVLGGKPIRVKKADE